MHTFSLTSILYLQVKTNKIKKSVNENNPHFLLLSQNKNKLYSVHFSVTQLQDSLAGALVSCAAFRQRAGSQAWRLDQTLTFQCEFLPEHITTCQ